MSKTSSYVKDRYNSKTYDRYTFYIRKDEALNDVLQKSIKTQPASQIAKDALTMFFDEKIEPQPGDNTRPKTTPDYSTKRQRRAGMKKVIKQLEQIKEAEERSRDNTPDNLQSAPAFEAAEECISALEEALETLREAYNLAK